MYGLTFAFHTFYFKLFRLIVLKKETPIGPQFAQIISNVSPINTWKFDYLFHVLSFGNDLRYVNSLYVSVKTTLNEQLLYMLNALLFDSLLFFV